MRRSNGFTLLEMVLVVLAGAAMVSSSLARARGLAMRTRCKANLKAIGMGFMIYCQDPVNDGAFPFMDGTSWESPTGTNRDAPNQPTKDHAITELLFMLVRYHAASVKHFVCPSDTDAKVMNGVNPEEDRDFGGPENVSYSYQAPVWNGNEWINGCDPAQRLSPAIVILSDKGPDFDGDAATKTASWQASMTDQARRGAMSDNHGGEAIEVLFLSLDITETTRGDYGVESDNIYSAGGDWSAQKSWRGSVDVDMRHHTDGRDSFLVGPYPRE